jgi:hypothetical protein
MYADAELKSNQICKINTNISEKTFQEFSNSSKTKFIDKVERYIIWYHIMQRYFVLKIRYLSMQRNFVLKEIWFHGTDAEIFYAKEDLIPLHAEIFCAKGDLVPWYADIFCSKGDDMHR